MSVRVLDSKLLPASTWRLRASRFEWEAQRSFYSISCTEKKNENKEKFQNENQKKNEFKSEPLRLKKEKMPERPFEIMHVKGIERPKKGRTSPESLKVGAGC